MPRTRSLGKTIEIFFCLGSCLALAPTHALSVRLLADRVHAQLLPGTPTSRPAPSPRLAPHVLYQEEVVLESGDRSVKLRFYSEEDPANPPLRFRAWEAERSLEPVREAAPEELVRMGAKNGNPVRNAWTIPMAFAARETKHIRIEAEYPVLPVPDRLKNDRFETYFSFWGWQPSNADLSFRFDLAPIIAAIPCIGRPPTPGSASWFFTSWFLIRPAGYESKGFMVWWRFRTARTPERCEKISVEWPAWYR